MACVRSAAGRVVPLTSETNRSGTLVHHITQLMEQRADQSMSGSWPITSNKDQTMSIDQKECTWSSTMSGLEKLGGV
jgi:hypothetical protein